MYPRYYALRRLNPYRGIVQIVDVGRASAHSGDGVTWYLRGDDGYGGGRPTGIWARGEGLKLGHVVDQGDLLAALEMQPELPFPMADTVELWLIKKETGLPLALLAADRPSAHLPGPINPEWFSFVEKYSAFVSPTLAARAVGNPYSRAQHNEFVAQIVNQAARPHASAQWFYRTVDGGGSGLEGHRMEPGWMGRKLAAADFPELIVSEKWNNRLEQSVINDYHAWLAPLLLLLPNLSDATRERLEAAATSRTQWLLRTHRLLPKVLNPGRLNAALVAAKLEAAMAEGETDYFAN